MTDIEKAARAADIKEVAAAKAVVRAEKALLTAKAAAERTAADLKHARATAITA